MSRPLRHLALTAALSTGLAACADDAARAEDAPTPPAAAPASTEALCEHGVVDAICPKCHPALAAVYKAKGDWCEEHGFQESLCPICHPEAGGRPEADLSRDDAPPDGTRIKLATEETADLAGIETVKAGSAERTPTAEALVRVRYDATKRALVSAPATGVVRSLEADVGTSVRAGQVLLVVDSVGVGADRSQLVAAEARLRAAEANLERERDLFEKGVSPARDVERAESERDEARAQVQAARAALGVVGAADKGAGVYSIRAPLAGVVTQRLATIGQSVRANEPLFEVVDPSSMWADLAVPEQDLPRVRPGQTSRIRIDALEGEVFEGEIDFLAPAIDPRTRTALARVRLDNPEGRLRAHMFGRADIVLDVGRGAVVVPADAVQRAEGQSFVFVKTGPDAFEARRVKLGHTDEVVAEIRDGLRAGEEVATTGSFLLKTEILKGAIGAGCCE